METKFKISKKNQKLIDVLKVKMRLLVEEFELSYDVDGSTGWMLRLSVKCNKHRIDDTFFSSITLSSTPWNWQFDGGLTRALEDMDKKVDRRLNPEVTKVVL